ncbi:MAG: GNAT family N-acetyltransferase [Pseudohongiella sp.]|nr:GNAT family N-acetyltransferase [Pseudohongiella sp.]
MNSSNTNYEFYRVLDKAGVDDYVKLFRAVYGYDKKLSYLYLRWLYEGNPCGRAVGFDAFFDGELIAHYVLVPRTYQLNEVKLSALLSVNTATHLAHQRKGLFIKLANLAYESAANAGFEFVLGVANQNSIHGFTTKLGFANLGQVRLAICKDFELAHNNVISMAITEDWLRWRISNPSVVYSKRDLVCGRAQIFAKRKGVNFLLGNFSSELLKKIDKDLLSQKLPFTPYLRPYFPVERKISLNLPARLQSSPWHVIAKPLSTKIDIYTLSTIQIRGLDMDTF